MPLSSSRSLIVGLALLTDTSISPGNHRSLMLGGTVSRVKSLGFGTRRIWIISSVILSDLLKFSKSLFLVCKREVVMVTYHTGLTED